jgi:hypothetical protein
MTGLWVIAHEVSEARLFLISPCSHFLASADTEGFVRSSGFAILLDW